MKIYWASNKLILMQIVYKMYVFLSFISCRANTKTQSTTKTPQVLFLSKLSSMNGQKGRKFNFLQILQILFLKRFQRYQLSIKDDFAVRNEKWFCLNTNYIASFFQIGLFFLSPVVHRVLVSRTIVLSSRAVVLINNFNQNTILNNKQLDLSSCK